jgi:hypothetical protein
LILRMRPARGAEDGETREKEPRVVKALNSCLYRQSMAVRRGIVEGRRRIQNEQSGADAVGP